MDKVIKRINDKCREAVKKLVIYNFHKKKGKRAEDTYLKPVKCSTKVDL